MEPSTAIRCIGMAAADATEAEASRVDARRNVELLDTTHIRSSADEQLCDVRAALRVLDAAGVPSVSYVDGAELTIEQRVRILASWATRTRGKR